MAQDAVNKKIITLFVIAIIISLAGNAFLFTKIKALSSGLNTAVEESANELAIMQNILTTTQEEYQKKIDMLASTLEKIGEESSIKISELEEEVKNVNIKSRDFSAVLNDVFKGVVSIITDKGQGSGAIITREGYIITNEHVIRDAKAIRVVDYNGNIYAVAVNGTDKSADIAILKINPRGSLDRLTFTNSDKVKVGEKVVAVGNPAGLGFTATEGIISQLGRFANKNNPAGLMQVDVPINPGNSGGPVININGNMVGIAKAKVAGFESLGFAIPGNTAKGAAESIMGKDF